MSSEEYGVADFVQLIQRVQGYIEWCILCYMNKSDCKHTLQFHHTIYPDLTERVWHRLENENEEFFRNYYVRLVLIEQIKKFNMLLEVLASRPPAPMSSYDPSSVLNRQQASPSEPPCQNIPLKAEEMQKLRVSHSFGSSIQPSPQRYVDAPFCDVYSGAPQRYVDVYSGAPQNTVPLTAVDMQERPMTHEFGSSPTLRMGDVSYPPPQCPISVGAGPSNLGYFQENSYMSGYNPIPQNLVDPPNRDAMTTQAERSVVAREACYCGSLSFDPNAYSNLVNLAPLSGDTISINYSNCEMHLNQK